MLIWMAWWFVGFLPAHQRGMIRADQSQPPLAASQLIPASPCGEACGMDPGPTDPQQPDPVAPCGICQIVAKLDVPRPFVVHLTPLAQAEPAAPPAARALCSRDAHPHYLGRAPPHL